MKSIKIRIKNFFKRFFPRLVFLYHEFRNKYYYQNYGTSITPWGFLFTGSPEMQNGTFENEEVEIVIRLISNCQVFVDIGANVGYFTCLARSRGVRVISIEPLLDNLSYLYKNLEINEWFDVEVFPMALGERPGIADIYGGGTGASLLKGWSGSSELWSKKISISTLDIILGERFQDQLIFIKIDVEGFEGLLLKGAVRTMNRAVKPIWMIEVCYQEHHPAGINPNFLDTFTLAWDCGYKTYTADASMREVNATNINSIIDNELFMHNYLFTELTFSQFPIKN